MKPRFKTLLLFIGPALVVLTVLRLYPLVYTIWLSFHSWSLIKPRPPLFVGFENYSRIVRDSSFWLSLKNTLIFALASVSIEFGVGLSVSLLLNHIKRARNLLTSLIIMPMMIVPVVVGVLWRMIFQDRVGLLNFLLGLPGLSRVSWLSDPHVALTSVIIVDIWQWTPFMILILLAGLQAIPQELYEASGIDGSGPFQSFRFITWPLLKPVMLVALMMRSMDAFRVFDTVFVLTEGGPGNSTDVLSNMLYRSAFRFFEMGYAAALAVVFLFVIICLTTPYLLQRRRLGAQKGEIG